MPAPSLVFEDVLPRITEKTAGHDSESHVEIIHDPSNGQEAGLLVESEFERVVVAKREQPQLSLDDVSRVRQMIVRARARRGLLCVPLDATIPNPVMLLATLSRIEIIRLGAGQIRA